MGVSGGGASLRNGTSGADMCVSSWEGGVWAACFVGQVDGVR